MITEHNIITKAIGLILEQKGPVKILDCFSALNLYDFYCKPQWVFLALSSEPELYKAFTKKHKPHDYQVVCLAIKLQKNLTSGFYSRESDTTKKVCLEKTAKRNSQAASRQNGIKKHNQFIGHILN